MRKRRRHRWWERGRLAMAMATGMLATGAFWWWLTTLGPRGVVGADAVGRGPAAAGLKEKRAQVQAWVEAAMAQRAGGEPAELAKALRLQEEVSAARGAGPEDVRRLAELERWWAEARARELAGAVADAERAGAQAASAGRRAEAEARWQEALAGQREINGSAAGAGHKNFVRESELERALLDLAAEPLAAEVRSALAVARQAAGAADWTRALAAYAVAREGQLRINGEYARTRFADTLVLGQIEQEVAALDAAGVAAEVDRWEAVGDEAQAAGDSAAATAAYAAARGAQEQLNREFPRSRFLSSARVEVLEVKRQTAASEPRVAGLREAEAAITRHLGLREVTLAAERIAEAEAELTALRETWPRSERLDPALGLKLAYLAAQRERLGEVQDAVFARLRPLPGVAELWLLQTEVPQALYQQVMKTNPSRQAGRAYPVDSVSWFDAQQFCERLGWMLGRTVRLPREAEFRIAVGGADEARRAVADVAAGEGGGGASRAMATGRPNGAGFFDLVGNLGEWLEAPAGESGEPPAPVAGGSYLDEESALATVPVERRPRTDRARHIGFRVVVDMTAEAGR